MNLVQFQPPFRKLLQSIKQTLHHSESRRYASEIMKKHMVVPDVIPVAPKELLQVTFPSGATVNGGNILTPTQVKDRPTINFKADSSSFYLFCMTDPDSPSRKRPTFREWHHWLVGNIPGTDVMKGEVLSDYISPCPPRDGGQHRYVLLVYKQSGQLTFDEQRLTNARTTGREFFRISKLAQKYQMGDPIAGNLFIAAWDEYVEKIYEDLSKL